MSGFEDVGELCEAIADFTRAPRADPLASPSQILGSRGERLEEEIARDRIGSRIDRLAERPVPNERADRAIAERLLRLALDRCAVEVENERGRYRADADEPDGGYADAAVGAAGDRIAISTIERRWRTFCDGLEAFEDARAHERHRWVEALGFASVSDALSRVSSRAVHVELDRYRRGAIAPLDDAVEAAGADRLRAASAVWGHEITPACEPALELAMDVEGLGGDGAERVPSPRALVAFGAVLGFDADAETGPAVVKGSGELASRLDGTSSPTPTVVVGTAAGPVGRRHAWSVYGVALQRYVLRSTRGRGAEVVCDPAFEHAAEFLFARASFDAESADRAALSVLRFERALEVRRAYLEADVAVQAASLDALDAFEHAWRRACARRPSPSRRLCRRRSDVRGLDRLAGATFAVLLEDRLKRRFGSRWFTVRNAGRLLRDLWASQPDTTLDEMASAIGLGRIEPTPLIDGFRP